MTCDPKAIQEATPSAAVRPISLRPKTSAGDPLATAGGMSARVSSTGGTGLAVVSELDVRMPSERLASATRPCDSSQRGDSGSRRR